MNSEIKMIPVDKLHPHEKNPRKSVGDVTNLAASIKKSGVMQNLTVVPATGYWHGDYIVVIGHRRLAAAKAAGLTELPCVVSDMTEKEQLATMLAENMQRTELTPVEQVHGVQQMLDIGETVDEIADKIGFSKKMVRDRSRFIPLFENKSFIQAAENTGRQISFSDMEKLMEIQSEKGKADAIKQLGTDDFTVKANIIIRDEKRAAKSAELHAELDARGIEKSDSHPTGYFYNGYFDTAESLREAIDGEDPEKFTYVETGYAIYLYKEAANADTDKETAKAERDKQEAQRRERVGRLDELAEEIYERRCEFIKGIKEDKMSLSAIKAVFMLMFENETADYEDVAELLGVEFDEDAETAEERFKPFAGTATAEPFRLLLLCSYTAADYKKSTAHYSYRGEYYENESLKDIYKFLVKLGYKPTKEEEAYINGTHELFLPEEVGD